MSSAPQRLVVITGGAGTLGSAFHAVFQKAGYAVLAPGRAELEVTSSRSVEAFFAGVSRVDLLINNAGNIADALSSRMSREDFSSVLDVHLRGAMLCSRAALAKMSWGGHLVQIGSHSAWEGKLGQANYTAAKAGLIGLTHSLARELGAQGIRVNCVIPGFFESKMTRGLSEEARNRILQSHCLPQLGSPLETARFVEVLDQMQAVSGQVFHLDSRVVPWT